MKQKFNGRAPRRFEAWLGSEFIQSAHPFITYRNGRWMEHRTLSGAMRAAQRFGSMVYSFDKGEWR